MDLGCAYLYPLHDSFYEKPFCFQLVERALPCLATVNYLCAPSQDELQVKIKAFLMIHLKTGDNKNASNYCILGMVRNSETIVYSTNGKSPEDSKTSGIEMFNLRNTRGNY